jgi:hypothetical protein
MIRGSTVSVVHACKRQRGYVRARVPTHLHGAAELLAVNRQPSIVNVLVPRT